MPWRNLPADRRASDATYKDPAYQAARAAALRRAGGRCEKCGTRARRLNTDHIIPVAQGGTHDLANLQVLCSGPGSCHASKTASDGNANRRNRSRAPADPDPRPSPWAAAS